MIELQLITIQKVFAMNKPLHQYLESKELNKQNMPFFIEKGNTNPHNIIMLSPLGKLFWFKYQEGRYKSVSFEDPYILQEALFQLRFAVGTYKYPFFAETLSRIYRNLSYKPAIQPLF